MAEYIEREAFVKEQRHLYCENCARRKGMKNGKMRFVYEIGDAPCRACGYGDVLDDLEDFPAADVRPVVRGRDICGTVNGHCEFKCSVCGVELSSVYGGDNDFGLDGGYFNYCPNCGATMETRARWVPNVPPRDLRPRCSVCGELNPTKESTCPNCGATMEER